MPETEIAATMGYLTRALKTPTIGRVWETLGDQARTCLLYTSDAADEMD